MELGLEARVGQDGGVVVDGVDGETDGAQRLRELDVRQEGEPEGGGTASQESVRLTIGFQSRIDFLEGRGSFAHQLESTRTSECTFQLLEGGGGRSSSHAK